MGLKIVSFNKLVVNLPNRNLNFFMDNFPKYSINVESQLDEENQAQALDKKMFFICKKCAQIDLCLILYSAEPPERYLI